MNDKLLTLHDAAEHLGVHYMTAYRYVRTGRLPGVKLGAEWRVRAADLDSFRVGGPTQTTGRAPSGTRRRRDYPRLVEGRLVAGDEQGAWSTVQTALASGVEPAELYLDVLGPALVSIGDRWAGGELSVAEEHRACAVVQRLIGRLGPLFARRGRKRGTVVIGAPQGEQHALPCALLADLARGDGFSVVELGADTPASSFVDGACEADRLVAVGLGVTTPDNWPNVADAVATIRTSLGVPVVLGGLAVPDATTAAELGADLWSADARSALDLFGELADDAVRARRRVRHA